MTNFNIVILTITQNNYSKVISYLNKLYSNHQTRSILFSKLANKRNDYRINDLPVYSQCQSFFACHPCVTHVFKISARVEYLLPQLKVLILSPLIVLLAEEICLSNVLQTEKSESFLGANWCHIPLGQILERCYFNIKIYL